MTRLRIVPLALCLLIGIGVGYMTRASGKSDRSRRVLYYQDPMHPAYRTDKPGVAPDCGMDLVPVYADNLASSVSSEGRPASTESSIDPAIQRLYGINVVSAQSKGEKNQIRIFGRIQPDETRVYKVDFGTDGYVKETHNDAVGTHVRKDQHLATVYSPDFLSMAGGYLASAERTPGSAPPPSQNATSSQARADRLRNLGMSDAQIEEITRTHKLPEDVYIVSPADGYILSRSISAGVRLERHNELYTIADLSHVWVVAQSFGKDTESIHVGMKGRVRVPDSDEVISAVVVSVLPAVDVPSGATNIRLEADNPGLKLRAGMPVNVEFPVAMPPGITVPVDAIMDSGNAKRVFVRTADFRFVPRVVQTGWQIGDRVQVVSGLNEGEMIAGSGTFLLDSESRLHATGEITQR